MKSANKRTLIPEMTDAELITLADQLAKAYWESDTIGFHEVAQCAERYFAERGRTETRAVDTAASRAPAETLKKALDAVGLFLEYAEKNAVVNGDGRVYFCDGEVFRIMLNTSRNLLEIINDYPA